MCYANAVYSRCLTSEHCIMLTQTSTDLNNVRLYSTTIFTPPTPMIIHVDHYRTICYVSAVYSRCLTSEHCIICTQTNTNLNNVRLYSATIFSPPPPYPHDHSCGPFQNHELCQCCLQPMPDLRTLYNMHPYQYKLQQCKIM